MSELTSILNVCYVPCAETGWLTAHITSPNDFTNMFLIYLLLYSRAIKISCIQKYLKNFYVNNAVYGTEDDFCGRKTADKHGDGEALFYIDDDK